MLNLPKPSFVEIKDAVFSLKQKSDIGLYIWIWWHFFIIILKILLEMMCIMQLRKGWILPNLNSNLVVLIPKFSGTIALANFQYKIIFNFLEDKLLVVAG